MKFRKHKSDQRQSRRSAPTSTPGVFSYYSQRTSTPSNPESVGRRQEAVPTTRQTRFHIGYLPTYIALTALITALAYSLWLQPRPRLHVMSQSGTVYRDNEVYQSGIEAIWRRNLLNQSKLTVRDQQIRREVLAQFGELQDMQIELPLLGRRPAVTLIPARPALKLVSGNGTFYVGSNGRVMAKTSDVTENEIHGLPLIRDETGIDAEPGKLAIPEQQAVFLAKLYAQLTDAKLSVQSIALPSTAANQADVRLTDTPYYIKFHMGTDPRQAVGSYLAVRDKLITEGKIPAEYVDVRVEEKVFYR